MIPKVIHYIWLGGKPLPKIAQKCIESWKKFCPNFEIKKWADIRTTAHPNHTPLS